MKKYLLPLVTMFVTAGIAGCGDTDTSTTIKKQSTIDSDGNEKTKIETKTETKAPNGDSTTTKETKETKIEIKHND